ncbi:MAG: channel protein TolC, partial [Leptothrix sp. (in: b-proteobacteria)]
MNLPLPNQPLRLLALAALAILSSSAGAQSLKALVETARDYDASYLSAKALAESAQYRAAQSDALNLPS